MAGIEVISSTDLWHTRLDTGKHLVLSGCTVKLIRTYKSTSTSVAYVPCVPCTSTSQSVRTSLVVSLCLILTILPTVPGRQGILLVSLRLIEVPTTAHIDACDCSSASMTIS